ncbi:hypothetical protein [Saccharopolyspora tripterygii]
MSKRDQQPWHRIVKKSWWDGSMFTLCGMKIPGNRAVSDTWFLPRTGPDCPACEALNKQGR